MAQTFLQILALVETVCRAIRLRPISLKSYEAVYHVCKMSIRELFWVCRTFNFSEYISYHSISCVLGHHFLLKVCIDRNVFCSPLFAKRSFTSLFYLWELSFKVQWKIYLVTVDLESSLELQRFHQRNLCYQSISLVYSAHVDLKQRSTVCSFSQISVSAFHLRFSQQHTHY